MFGILFYAPRSSNNVKKRSQNLIEALIRKKSCCVRAISFYEKDKNLRLLRQISAVCARLKARKETASIDIFEDYNEST